MLVKNTKTYNTEIGIAGLCDCFDNVSNAGNGWDHSRDKEEEWGGIQSSPAKDNEESDDGEFSLPPLLPPPPSYQPSKLNSWKRALKPTPAHRSDVPRAKKRKLVNMYL